MHDFGNGTYDAYGLLSITLSILQSEINTSNDPCYLKLPFTNIDFKIISLLQPILQEKKIARQAVQETF